MFTINDDLSIYVTRGDMAFFNVSAEEDGKPYTFKEGDIVRIKVTEKKACENVMFQKDFPVTAPTENVSILLTEEDTKIGDVISKPTDYWYEIELNPYSNPQTIIGYDEEGAKIFKLFPEGKDIGTTTKEEDVPVVDAELDATSQRPVENQAITRGMIALENKLREEFEEAVQQRINELESIDQSYNPESISAQSGKAVSQAVANTYNMIDELQSQLNYKISGNSEKFSFNQYNLCEMGTGHYGSMTIVGAFADGTQTYYDFWLVRPSFLRDNYKYAVLHLGGDGSNKFNLSASNNAFTVSVNDYSDIDFDKANVIRIALG